MSNKTNKRNDPYKRIAALEELHGADWELEAESLAVLAKYKKMQYDAFIEAGFSTFEAITLVSSSK